MKVIRLDLMRTAMRRILAQHPARYPVSSDRIEPVIEHAVALRANVQMGLITPPSSELSADESAVARQLAVAMESVD